ncbi:hypothetical protein [Microbispora rosea]
MAPRTARIHLDRTGYGSSLEVDGQRLPGVRGINLDASARHTPRLVVDLLMHEIEVDGEMTVSVPDKTREALVALGWTPPAEGDADEPSEERALTSEERALIHAALRTLPTECRYHGANTEPEPRDRLYGREACCDTGIAAQRRKLAEQALLTHTARSSS